MQISRLTFVPVAGAIGGAIVGAVISLAMPPVYASTSWVLVQVPGTAADASERGQRIRTAIEAALHETAFDENAIAVTLRGEPGRDPVLLEVSASADSARSAKQATDKALGAIIEANFVASERLGQSRNVQFRAVQPANLPTTAQRDTTRNGAIGGGLGLTIGAIVAFVRHRQRRSDGADLPSQR